MVNQLKRMLHASLYPKMILPLCLPWWKGFLVQHDDIHVSQVMTMFMPSPLATTFWHSILKKIILLPLGWRILPLRYRISELMRSEPNLRVTKIESQGFHIPNFKCTGVSGADAQLCMRSIDKWEKAKIKVHTSTSWPSIPLTVKTQA
ncbi:uncharacterized protein LOC116139448 [Pistacia vera]|uniref:uncharacterized protein LOC116139448 n=1 Tax=Pistacia vera TaxID=55513 RepID=UPI001263CC2E|nr:uncharacterized protein LOC116139448 [Pistacia vera]